jgi:hypothetical protein
MKRLSLGALCAFAVGILQFGCGGSAQPQVTAQTVTIDSISPQPTVNGPAFTMQVNGSGFVPGTNLYFVAGPVSGFITVTQVTDTQLTVSFPADAFPSNTQYAIQAYSPITPCGNQYCGNRYSNFFWIDLR